VLPPWSLPASLRRRIISRAKSNRELVQVDEPAGGTTVALAQLKQGDQYQIEIARDHPGLPQGALYARVNGYLKSWELDIGAPVQPANARGD